MIKVALFDLDGVVFDTEPQYTIFWNGICREFRPDLPGLEHQIKGQTLIQIYDKYFSGLKDVQTVITRRLNEYEKRMEYRYIAGLEDFLKDLKHNGVHTAVVTSSNLEKMECVYAQHPEFSALFDRILTAEDFSKSKPDPDCYLKGARAFDEEVAHCVGFEDSFNGLKAVRAAGMFTVGLSTTNLAEDVASYADYVMSDYTDIDYSKLVELAHLS